MSEHASSLRPSSAHRWVVCPGSARLGALYPDKPPHPLTIEGDACHEVAATILKDFVEYGLHGHRYNRENLRNTRASNGTVMTDDLLDLVDAYVRDVIQTSCGFDAADRVMVEHRVSMAKLIHPENWGTLDAAIVFHRLSSGRLVVSDFKTGWGIVEPWENWQLIDYTAGLLSDMTERGVPWPTTIELRIVQPRPYHRNGRIRSWKVAVDDLMPYFQRLSQSAHEALGPNPSFVPGPHCDFCPAAEGCDALRGSNYRNFEVLRGLSPQDLIGTDLGQTLTFINEVETLAKALRQALEDKALIEIQQGRPVAGWEWATSESRVKWRVEIDEVTALGDLYGVELRVPGAKTPKQAVSAGLPEEVVKSISSSESTGIKLVPADLKRTAAIFKQP
jgi:hypothetical protein